MKKSKRLISLALSAITALSAVSAMNTSALYWWGSIDESLIEETFADCVKLDTKEYECFDLNESEYMYMLEENSKMTVFALDKADDYIYIEVGTDIDTSELEKQIKALDEGFEIVKNKATSNTNFIKVLSEKFPIETVKEIREIVGDKALKIEYTFSLYNYNNLNFDYITGYDITRVVDTIEKDGRTEYIFESNEEMLTEYAENHSDMVELKLYCPPDKDFRGFSLWTETYYLIPKKELTAMEHLELAKDIYEETGLSPFGYSLESANPPIGKTFNLTSYLNGDANCDNIQSMADAASIFQAIGNPDKYALSDLGEFNADYAGDGLTPDDAIAIQKKLAGIE